ncbi:MAG: hypothetical protein Q9M28_04290, partial [Mariprofundaceae bacterium]|nr:hypothetical protein [Mariprofundaceae bacterium]
MKKNVIPEAIALPKTPAIKTIRILQNKCYRGSLALLGLLLFLLSPAILHAVPAANGTYDFSVFTDGGNNLTHNDFTLSGTANGVAMNMAILSPFATGDNQWGSCIYKLTADGTNTASFELTGISANDFDTLVLITNVSLVGNKAAGGTVAGVNNPLPGGNTTGTKDNFNTAGFDLTNFSGVQLSSFEIQFTTPNTGNTCGNMNFNSFAIINALAPSTNNAPTGSVTISGTTTKNSTLTANNTLADADVLGTFSYQWKRGATNIGTNSNLYTLVQADVGTTITVTISYTDGAANAEVVASAPTATIADVAANSAPALGGTFTTAGTVNDNATITPFSAVTVSDANPADLVSVNIRYTATHGTFTGTGGTGIPGNYTVIAATPATAQANLQAATFIPTPGQVTTGKTVLSTFTLTPNDGTVDGTANATTQVTATSIAKTANVEHTPAIIGTTFSNTGNQMGQSFIAPRSGTLASLGITSSVASTGATLKIYSGDGIAGTLLHTQTIAVDNNTTAAAGVVSAYIYQAVPLNLVVSVISGQSYTFDITATGYFPVFDGNNYTGGMQYNTGTGVPAYDLFFQAVINGSNNAPALGGSFNSIAAINDNATIAPFSGVTLIDADGDMLSVNITYTAANGTLSGTGLSINSAGNYTILSSAIATAQTNLQAVVFTPTAAQVAVGSTVVSNFSLTPNDTTVDGTANATTKVTVTAVDTTKPLIAVNGADPYTFEVGLTYVDPLATVTDNVDATNTTLAGTSTVNSAVVGNYT